MLNEKKFRFWCQTVLPLVYDDSLSYYELLNKVVNYLNNTIQDVQDISDDYQEFEESVNTQLATLTQDMTTLANTVGQFDDRITLNTNEIHILDNEMEDTLQYEGVVTTFPNPTKYGFYKVPEGHDASFPEDHVAGSLIIISDSQGETFTATYLTNTGRVYNKMKNALGWSEWASEDVANQERIAQSNQNIEVLQAEDLKTLKYRGFTIQAENLAEIESGANPQYYYSGYYTPQAGQGDMPTGETITVQNMYRYLICVVNNFTRDPSEILDKSERTWILYGPNAKLWWAHGNRPRSNTWSVFDPSAIDVSNLEQMVQTLSAQYEAVDDRMDDIEGAVTTNTSNISSLNTRVNNNSNDITSLNTRVNTNASDISALRTRVGAAESDITTLAGESIKWGEDLSAATPATILNKMLENAIYYVQKNSVFPGVGWTNGMLICRRGNQNNVPTICTLVTDKGGIFTRKLTNSGWGSWTRTTDIYNYDLSGDTYFHGVKIGGTGIAFYIPVSFSLSGYGQNLSEVTIQTINTNGIYKADGTTVLANVDLNDGTNYTTSLRKINDGLIRVLVSESSASGPLHALPLHTTVSISFQASTAEHTLKLSFE